MKAVQNTKCHITKNSSAGLILSPESSRQYSSILQKEGSFIQSKFSKSLLALTFNSKDKDVVGKASRDNRLSILSMIRRALAENSRFMSIIKVGTKRVYLLANRRRQTPSKLINSQILGWVAYVLSITLSVLHRPSYMSLGDSVNRIEKNLTFGFVLVWRLALPRTLSIV